ncbi:MAG: MFS transporter [Rhodospirillales bacterium]
MNGLLSLRTIGLTSGALAVQATITMASLTLAMLAADPRSGFDISRSLVGLYTSSVYLGAAIGAMLAGGFVARYGPVRVSQFSLFSAMVGVAALAFGNIWIALPVAFFIGLGYGPANPSASELLARHTPKAYRPLIFSLKQTGVPIGAGAAGLCVPLLLGYMSGAETALIIAGFSGVLVLLFQPWREQFDTGRNPAAAIGYQEVRESMAMVMSYPNLRLLAAASFGFAIIQLSVGAFMVLYLTEAIGLTVIQAGGVYAVIQACGVVGRIAWGAILVRIGDEKGMAMLAFLALLMAIGSGCAAIMNGGWPMPAIISVCALLGFSAVGWNGIFMAEVANQAPADKTAAATGISIGCTFSGVVVGPVIFGILADLTGSYAVGFSALAILTGIAAIVLYTAYRRTVGLTTA